VESGKGLKIIEQNELIGDGFIAPNGSLNSHYECLEKLSQKKISDPLIFEEF